MLRTAPSHALVYSPGEAAKQLEVSTATLRRMAGVYERVHGELPRTARGDRYFPEVVLERLSAARVLRDRGDLANLEAALRSLQDGDAPVIAQLDDKDQLLLELVEEVRSLKRAVEQLTEQNNVLHAQLAPPPRERSGKRWWQFWRRS